jgi:hypothetical protein
MKELLELHCLRIPDGQGSDPQMDPNRTRKALDALRHTLSRNEDRRRLSVRSVCKSVPCET